MAANDVDMGLFAAWLRAQGAADRTISDRTTIVAAFIRAHPDFPHTPDHDVLTWLGRPGRSAWTRVTYFSHLASAFAWSVELGTIDRSPLDGVKRPRTPRRKPRPLTSAEIACVLLAASGDERAWVVLALYAGLRVHEIAKLRGEDIDGGTLFVRGKGGKDAFLPVHPEVAALAQSYPRRGYWFPSRRSTSGHISRNQMSVRISRLMTTAGVAGGLHRLRHSYGTTLLRNGANIRVVQTLMRHESLATTEGYLEVVEAEQTAAIASLCFEAA